MGMALAARASTATDAPGCGPSSPALRARLAALAAHGGQPRAGRSSAATRSIAEAGDAGELRAALAALARRIHEDEVERCRRDGRATAPSCCRRARACSRTATPARSPPAATARRSAWCAPRMTRDPEPARLGRRDAPAAAGRAADGLGAGRGRHPAHADRRRRGRAAVRARARRRGRVRRRPHRRQRRRGQQDRLVHAVGAGARARRALLRRRAHLDDRPRHRERRGDPDRGARAPTRSRASAGARSAPAGTAVANPAFDVTPAGNMTAIVTERGVHRPPFEQSLPAAALSAAQHFRHGPRRTRDSGRT